MRRPYTRFTLLLILVASAGLTIGLPAANACGKCAKHNKATEPADEHGHEHLDEDEGFVTILGKGHTDGWAIDKDWMKIEDGVLIAGSMDKPIPKTMYAAHDKTYYNFELRAQVKAIGPEQTNGGIQFRSSYDEKTGAMAGYQADMGHKYWGRLYDQSRGRGLLGQHEKDVDLKKDIHWDGWNDYVVRCEGPRIRIWINGKLFTDYTETNEKFIEVRGAIGLQLHGGPASVRQYRNIRIKELD